MHDRWLLVGAHLRLPPSPPPHFKHSPRPLSFEQVIELDELADGSKVQDAVTQLTGRRTVPQVGAYAVQCELAQSCWGVLLLNKLKCCMLFPASSLAMALLLDPSRPVLPFDRCLWVGSMWAAATIPWQQCGTASSRRCWRRQACRPSCERGCASLGNALCGRPLYLSSLL